MVFKDIVIGYDTGNYVADGQTDRETQMNLGF
jgi:hypothetical protein